MFYKYTISFFLLQNVMFNYGTKYLQIELH